jgi:hypothetical protein
MSNFGSFATLKVTKNLHLIQSVQANSTRNLVDNSEFIKYSVCLDSLNLVNFHFRTPLLNEINLKYSSFRFGHQSDCM